MGLHAGNKYTTGGVAVYCIILYKYIYCIIQPCIFPLGRSRYLTVSGAAYVAARTTERSVERAACGVPLLPASIALQPRESRSPATSCAPLQRPSDLFIAGEPSFAAASDDTSQRSGNKLQVRSRV